MLRINNKFVASIACLTMLSSLSSCGNKLTGKIIFDLNGGSFPADFNTMELEGPAGAKVEIDIPDPSKDGYEFVGWREKKADGSYRVVSKQYDETDGKYYFHYPYVEDTLYAYYEKLVTISFDLTEAASKNGVLVAPEKNPESFKNNQLYGYANKSISTESLPTAKAEGSHLTFEYWYTEYPLKAVQNENKETHYFLDMEKDKGVYKFDSTLFSEGNMVFPTPTEEESFTLYAHWKNDPRVTIHYNLEGIADSSFQTNESDFEQDLIAQLKSDIQIDFGANGEEYRYYPANTKEKRFAGFYLDADFKNPISLNSSISDSDMDIYLKWNNHIDVVLDYNGGEVNGMTEETFTGLYAGDVLGTEFYDSHKPVKEDGEFLYFIDTEGKVFNFSSELPNHSLRLSAVYDDFPMLRLNYDYPSNFVGTKLDNMVMPVRPSSDISTYLKTFEEAFVNGQPAEDHLEPVYFYTIDEDGKENAYVHEGMPVNDFELNLKICYQWAFNVSTFINTSADGTYQKVDDYSFTKYFRSDDNVDYDSLDPDFMTEKSIEGDTYLYNGLFLGNETTTPTTEADFASLELAQLPIVVSDENQVEVVEKYFIRRLTKSITITFNDNGNTDKTMKIIPGSKLSRYESEIKQLLGEYKSLYVMSGDVRQEIVTVLPKEDTVIYVER